MKKQLNSRYATIIYGYKELEQSSDIYNVSFSFIHIVLDI